MKELIFPASVGIGILLSCIYMHFQEKITKLETKIAIMETVSAMEKQMKKHMEKE